MAGDATVMDLLERLSPLDATSRRMFGGHGIYLRGQMFAIVDDGRIYFRVDDALKAEFVELGSGPFDYAQGKTISSFYELPVDILEETPRLLETARRSHAAAVARKKAGPKRR